MGRVNRWLIWLGTVGAFTGAHAETISFEAVPDNTLLDDEFVAQGVEFDSSGPLSGLVLTEGDFGTVNFGNSPSQFIHVGQRDEPTTIRFVDPANPTTVIGASSVSFLVGDGNPDRETVEITYRSPSGVVIGRPPATTTSDSGVWVFESAARLGSMIGSVELRLTATSESGALFDDLSFQLAVDGQAVGPDLPISAEQITLHSTSAEHDHIYTVDLGRLPTRPSLVVEATPDADHRDMSLLIEALNWQLSANHEGFGCPDEYPNPPIANPIAPGSARLDHSLVDCDPEPGDFAGQLVEVRIHAISLGSNPAPATVWVVIRGETIVPTSPGSQLVQEVDSAGHSQKVIPASKDSVLYENLPQLSNGDGAFLWSGESLSGHLERRAIIAFDVASSISENAIVEQAEIRFGVASVLGPGGILSLHRVLPGFTSTTWAEGNADAGSGFNGDPSTTPAANWEAREEDLSEISPTTPWQTPGGDFASPPLAQIGISLNDLGPQSIASPALNQSIQDMVVTKEDENGFLLRGPIAVAETNAIQIASRENLTGLQRPELHVSYFQDEIHESGVVETGVVPFISEGQNFRWIYDLDGDGILATTIGGLCEVEDPPPLNQIPYVYRFQGANEFTGVDCCTWRIESPQTGTVGTGQALFFHGLDASNPANFPPDSDRDGIRNLCDSCPSIPNGPLLGTCLWGSLEGAACRSNLDCGTGVKCSLSQEDFDSDLQGDACPEPGFAVGLFAGIAVIGGLVKARGRRLVD